MVEDTIEFGDMENYKGQSYKQGLTFKQIILNHVNRCVVNGSVEWHGGQWEQKIVNNQQERKYIPDTRQTFNNSIKMLRVVLIGYFDKIMLEDEKRIIDCIRRIEDEFKVYKLSGDVNKKKEYDEKIIEMYVEWFESLIKLAKRLNFFEEEEVMLTL